MRPKQNITEKPKNFFDTWMKLIKYSKEHWKGLLFAILFAAGGNILTVLGPDRLADMTDVITAGIESSIDMKAVPNIGLSLLFLYGLGGLFNLLQGWIMVNVTQTISKSLERTFQVRLIVYQWHILVIQLLEILCLGLLMMSILWNGIEYECTKPDFIRNHVSGTLIMMLLTMVG